MYPSTRLLCIILALALAAASSSCGRKSDRNEATSGSMARLKQISGLIEMYLEAEYGLAGKDLPTLMSDWDRIGLLRAESIDPDRIKQDPAGRPYSMSSSQTGDTITGVIHAQGADWPRLEYSYNTKTKKYRGSVKESP